MSSRKKLLILFPALAAGGAALLATRWPAGGQNSSAAGGSGHSQVRMTLFLRLKDEASVHAIPNLLEAAGSAGGAAVVEAAILESEGGANDDRLAACSARQGGTKGLHFLLCRQSMGIGNDDWAPCAEEAGLDRVALDRCAKGDEGPSLLAANAVEASRAGVFSTPALFLNGKRVDSDGTRATIQRALCEAVGSDSGGCAVESSPSGNGFRIAIMTDSRCRECRASFWFRRMQMLFPAADVRILDVALPENRVRYDAEAPGLLPAVILDAQVERDPGFPRLRRELLKRPDGYILSPETVRPSFDPTR